MSPKRKAAGEPRPRVLSSGLFRVVVHGLMMRHKIPKNLRIREWLSSFQCMVEGDGVV
jgi:hypothetical protein